MKQEKFAKNMPTGSAHNAQELSDLLHKQTANSHSKLGQHLLNQGQITPEDLRAALKTSNEQSGKKLGEVLIESRLITQEVLRTALIAQLEVPFVALKNFEFNPAILQLLPEKIARRFHLFPLMMHEHSLVVAAPDLPTQEILDVLRFTTQHPIIIVMSELEEIDTQIRTHYLEEAENEELSQFEQSLEIIEETPEDIQEAEFLAKQQPIVKLVDAMFHDAILRKASDIHIRPEAKHFDLLFRVDGSMIKIREYARSLLPAVVGRIKILSRLNIAERRLPQDGRITYSQDKNKIDLRISIIPVQYGESIVIRILNKNQGLRSIRQIGFEDKDQARLLDLFNRSHGIILVTGPTGSGKSTTLYAALQEVVKNDVNIVTVEDPIEYELPGTRQIQLIPTINFSFPQALRHILRHDPDVIMIGEMRDLETCKIAVESALTGHLVFSTLHTNDAPSSIIRLLEIGVESYMIRSAVIGILAQRLVRKNCPHCLKEEAVAALMRENLQLDPNEKFYQGSGCEHCHHTGFSGRLAVYELMVINEALRELIAPGMSVDDLRHRAVKHGMTPLPINGIAQARLKNTSIAEVYRACM